MFAKHELTHNNPSKKNNYLFKKLEVKLDFKRRRTMIKIKMNIMFFISSL